jgi:hypothetical protein
MAPHRSECQEALLLQKIYLMLRFLCLLKDLFFLLGLILWANYHRPFALNCSTPRIYFDMRMTRKGKWLVIFAT